MKYAAPNEAQSAMLRRNGIDPERVFVVHETEESVLFRHYQSGDEIKIRPNQEKESRRKNGW